MHIESTDKQGVFKACEQGHKLLELISDMGWDYDRFSSSGQDTYDKICVILGTVEEDKNANTDVKEYLLHTWLPLLALMIGMVLKLYFEAYREKHESKPYLDA